jgi:hypothetical protein
MTSRLFSLIAVPLVLVGHLLFWGSSATLIAGVQRGSGVDAGAVGLAGIGIVLILGSIGTVAIGSLGAYIVGGVQLLFSLVLHLVPFDPLHGGFSPAVELMNGVRSASTSLSDGLFFYFSPGAGAVIGAIFVGAGLAAEWRTATHPAGVTRVISALTAVVGLLGLALALIGGGAVYIGQLITLAGPRALDLVMLYGGVVLVGASLLAARWSSAGPILAGAVTSVLAVVVLASPRVLLGLPAAARRGAEIAGPSAILLLIGLLLVMAGLAVRVRARRAASITP